MTPIFDEIRASHLVEWAKAHETAQWMPSLMLQLVGASGAKVKSCRFLTHEEITTGGYDGVVESESDGVLVPAGSSVWELSKQNNTLKKARDDSKKRKVGLEEPVPATATLVSVHMRVWPKKKVKRRFVSAGTAKRMEERALAKAGGWKATKIIDAGDLASALALAPGVAIWLSTVMGRRVGGACSLLSHFNDLSSLSKPALPPAVFLTGRSALVTDLDKFLAGSPGILSVQTASPDDLRDAIAAWWKTCAEKAPPPLSGIIVQTTAAWEYLRTIDRPMLLLLEDGVGATPEQITAAIGNGHFLVRRTSEVSERHCRLPSFPSQELSQALVSAGIDPKRAWKLASDADGSGVILKYLLAGSAVPPPWAQGAGTVKLAPLVLIGSWDQSLKGDRERVAKIFGQPYPKVEALLRGQLDSNHPLVRLSGDEWRVVNREDTWRWLSPHLNLATCTRYTEGAKQVLGEIDPRYTLEVEKRPFAMLHGIKETHSNLLRRGFAETACLLALRPPASFKTKSVYFGVGTAAGSFPRDGAWQHWASLGSALPLLAEAAPVQFLEAVEDDLKRDKPGTAALFGEGGDGVFGQHLCANLMWALEGLLWSPDTVSRAVDALARLAALDPGGNTFPRPSSVLESAFSPAFGQCCLNVGDRGKLLAKVFRKEPKVGWQLGIKLLPRGRHVGSSPHQPKFRAVLEGPRPTWDDYWSAARQLIKLLLQAAGADLEKWRPMIEGMHQFPDDVFDLTIEEIKKLAAQLNAAKRADLCDVLRSEIQRHEYFAAKAAWAMPPAKLSKVAAVMADLQPTDPVLSNRWLFSRTHHMEVPGTNMDTPHDEQQRMLEKLQVEALRKVAGAGGLPDVLRLAKEAKYAATVGDLCARYRIVEADADILPVCLEHGEESVVSFAYGYARGHYLMLGWDWFKALGPERWQPATLAKLSTMFTFAPATWDKFAEFGQAYADEYWQRAHPWTGELKTADIDRAVAEFLRLGRPDAAVDCVSSARYTKTPVTSASVLRALEGYRDKLQTLQANQEDALRVHDGYRVSELIKVLHVAKDLTPEQAQALAGLEWFFLPILETNMVTPKTLTDGIRQDPAVYLQFVKLIYVPDRNVDLGIKIERTEETSKRAQNAHNLLGSIQELPGSVGGVVNEAEFLAWLTEVRRLAAEAGYVKSVENELGQLLTLAPNDPEGFWPCAPVARVLNDSNTKEMLGAFRAEIFNNQGRVGFMPSHPDMNPTKERKAAIARLRDNAAKLNLEFPIVAACLRDVADDQERFVVDFLEKD